MSTFSVSDGYCYASLLGIGSRVGCRYQLWDATHELEISLFELWGQSNLHNLQPKAGKNTAMITTRIP